MKPEDIKALRKELGLSQSDFAEKIGVKLRTVQNYESGQTSPTAETLTKMFALSGRDVPASEMFSSDNSLVVPGATVSMEQIALHVSKNEEYFLEHPIIKKIVDERVSRKVAYLIKNPDKLEDYLNS